MLREAKELLPDYAVSKKNQVCRYAMLISKQWKKLTNRILYVISNWGIVSAFCTNTMIEKVITKITTNLINMTEVKPGKFQS
ncbi:unnamed protein product [Bubo scandiacus]